MGLVVHYVGYEPQHRAAIVSRVTAHVEGEVDLQVLHIGYRDGSAGIARVQFDPTARLEGTWHFIEDVE